jgi:hypothetical protein
MLDNILPKGLFSVQPRATATPVATPKPTVSQPSKEAAFFGANPNFGSFNFSAMPRAIVPSYSANHPPTGSTGRLNVLG